MKSCILLLGFLIYSAAGICQDAPYFRDEYRFGVNFHTNGGLIGGLHGKRLRRIEDNNFRMLSLDLVNIKHDQEQRSSNPYTGNLYVIEKQNYFFVIRPTYGGEYILFQQSPDEGVQVNGSLGGGVSLGVLKPYFINYDYSTGKDQSDVRSEHYIPSKHTESNRILGRAGLLSGLGESSIIPGLNIRGSLNFQFSNQGKKVSGIEVGGVVEGFFKFGNGTFISRERINIIPEAERDWLYTALFVNIYYGFRK